MSTTTVPKTPAPTPSTLSPVELARWGWRQLTSMRTALILLFLLALAAIPGSVVPQSQVDALATSRWQEQHPRLTPVYERLGLFSVYDSIWFSAIYLLLMISLVGCILPRTRVYWRAMRARPPRAPRRLSRLPEHASYTCDEEPDVVLARARAILGRRRFRVLVTPDGPGSDGDVGVGGDGGDVAAERGYLREAGNLVFHIAVLVVLVGFGTGALFGYKGGVIVVAGNGFSNSLSQYDDFVPGALFDPARMEPFAFDVDSFDVTFLREGPRTGMAQRFVAGLTYREEPGAEDKAFDLRVNHPLSIGGTDVFLVGHGYAPEITVRDGRGDVAYAGPVIFLPQDDSFRSFGVVKAPDARPTQVGLEGELYPTYAFTEETGPFSAFGDDLNPALSMLVYTGDLGMDDGNAQSVYTLDKDNLETLAEADGTPFRLDISPGQTVQLPDGRGSVSFDGMKRWSKIQISRTPGMGLTLAGAIAALVGLLGSLFIRPRRIWVRARREGGRTVVEVAGLDRTGGGDLGTELANIRSVLETGDTSVKESP